MKTKTPKIGSRMKLALAACNRAGGMEMEKLALSVGLRGVLRHGLWTIGKCVGAGLVAIGQCQKTGDTLVCPLN